MPMDSKDLSNLQQTYRAILTEAHDETGTMSVQSQSLLTDQDHHEVEQVLRAIDHAIANVGDHHEDGDYQGASVEALEAIHKYVMDRLKELQGA